jgi:hypothetical protein
MAPRHLRSLDAIDLPTLTAIWSIVHDGVPSSSALIHRLLRVDARPVADRFSMNLHFARLRSSSGFICTGIVVRPASRAARRRRSDDELEVLRNGRTRID